MLCMIHSTFLVCSLFYGSFNISDYNVLNGGTNGDWEGKGREGPWAFSELKSIIRSLPVSKLRFE